MHVTIDTWFAVIGGIVAAVIGALVSWLLARPASARNDAYDKVTGSIDAPIPNAKVHKTLACSGFVTGLQGNLGLWLAVEKEERIWPKESRPNPGADNKWSVTLFEDGTKNEFSVALYVADPNASKQIQAWLKSGAETGSFPEMKSIPGARRLARVDGLLVQ